jgi:hypothetical protein
VFCISLLWPLRGFLFFEVQRSVGSHIIGKQEQHAPPDKKTIVITPRTPEEQKKADSATQWFDIRLLAPAALNLPVGIVQLPYAIASPSKQEWIPDGMFVHYWRAITWPLAGILFWWIAGRAIEALLAVRRSQICPKIRWIEFVFGSVFVCLGVIMIVGIATSTPDDRKDMWFMGMAIGAMLWGTQGGLIVAARVLQWRIGQTPGKSEQIATAAPSQ